MITKYASADLRKVFALAAGFSLASALALAAHAENAFIPAAINSSTIPAKGDLNPYGAAFDAATDTLFVASTADNAIYSVPYASQISSAADRGTHVFSDRHLRGPLALRLAPNGNLLTTNGDAVHGDVLHPSEIVEFTRWGEFVREYNVDASQGGAFGIDTREDDHGFNYAVIDDVTNSLLVTRLP